MKSETGFRTYSPRAALALGLLIVAASAHSAELPRILIYQEQDPPKEKVDLNLQVADMLAQEFDTAGTLQPVVWSITDPIFRDATLSGTVKSAPDSPTSSQLFAAADQLHATYLLVVKATIDANGGKGAAKLYRSHRSIWKDERNLRAGVGSRTSNLDTARSMAHTWVQVLGEGPLKGLKPQPKLTEPSIPAGQEPPKIDPPVVTPTQSPTGPVDSPTHAVPPPTPAVRSVDNAQLRRDVSSLLAGGRRAEAILRLRDAVDQEPLDLVRRQMLIDTLIEADPAGAASEARRVSELMPDHPELRILAARAWLRAGKTKEAREDLNEAIGRDPNGSPTRLMLAELGLREGKPQEALDNLAPILSAGPNAEARFLRALARTLLGGLDGAQQDLAEYGKLQAEPSPDEVARHYTLSVEAIDAASKKAFDDEKEFLRKAALRPKDQEVQDDLERLTRQAQAQAKFMGALTPPLGHHSSHERRLLGLRLLVQSLSDGQRYLTAPDDDAMTDARLNLGEAIKHLAAARAAFDKESESG